MAWKRAGSRAAVLFDRDGTLNVDRNYVFRSSDLEWVPGAIEAVRAVNERGMLAIVVTNQSGVGRGMYDLTDLNAFHAAMASDLAAKGARIEAWYSCPYSPDATVKEFRHPNHPDRKPNPGMVLRALSDFGLDPAGCLMIGDKVHDVLAGERAGVRGVLFNGGRLDDALVPMLDLLVKP